MEATGRPRKLDTTQENVLRVSIFVARITQVITQKDIATGFDISVPTLRRYYVAYERAVSQRLATEAYQRRKIESARHSTYCGFCDLKLKSHARCEDCNLLIHDILSDRNGGSPDMQRCFSCFDKARRDRIRAHGLAR